MRSYLISILAAALGVALLLLLLPENPGLRRGVRFVSLLLLLVLIFQPLMGAGEALQNFFSGDWFDGAEGNAYESLRDETLGAASAEYLERLIGEDLSSAFSIREGDLSVRVFTEGGEPARVLLLLSGRAIWLDSAKLESRVVSRLGLPTTSAIE